MLVSLRCSVSRARENYSSVGLAQIQSAEEEGESRKQLTEIEAGRSSPPSAYTMLRLEPKKGKNRHG